MRALASRTYQRPDQHLEVHQELLERRERGQVDSGQAGDAHRRNAEKQTVDILDMELRVARVEDTGKDKRYLCVSDEEGQPAARQYGYTQRYWEKVSDLFRLCDGQHSQAHHVHTVEV